MTNCAKGVDELSKKISGLQICKHEAIGDLDRCSIGKSVLSESLIGMGSRTSEKRGVRDHFVKRQNKVLGQWVKRKVGSRDICNSVFFFLFYRMFVVMKEMIW